MKAVRAIRWDHQARWTSRTRVRALRAATDDRFRRARVSEAVRLRAQAALRLLPGAMPPVRESIGCPKARASLKSSPRDRLRRAPESRPAPRAANHQGVLILCRGR